jgi:hypothetical protein
MQILLPDNMPRYVYNEGGTQEVALTPVKIWAVPGEQKVRPADPAENSNLVWSGADKRYRLPEPAMSMSPFRW